MNAREITDTDGYRFMTKVLFFVMIICFFIVLWKTCRGGSDYDRYLDWAKAATSGDIFAISSEVRSPMGVPFSQWSHGSGLLFSVIPYLLPESVNFFHATLFAGFIAAAIFWCAFYYVLRNVAGDNDDLIPFGIAIAFLATQLGFYSFTYASETFSYACAAILTYFVVVPWRWPLPNCLVIGLAGALMTIVRPYLIVFPVIMTGLVLYRAWKVQRPIDFSLISGLGLLILPVVLAITEVLLVNRWMTGSMLQSPYSFGNGNFKSFDFLHPNLLAILFHPWHGLLAYHPLYGIAFAAGALLIFRKDYSSAERIFLLVLMFSVLVLLYIQAAWYCWWLGLASFGMRNLGITAIVLVPLLIKYLKEMYSNWLIKRGFLFLILLSCAWSTTLLWQGNTDFVTYAMLFSSQKSIAGNQKVLYPILGIMIGVLLVMVMRKQLKHFYDYSGVRVLSAGLISVVIFYLLRFNHIQSRTMGILITSFIMGAFVFPVICAFSWKPMTLLPPKSLQLVVGCLIFCAFAISTGLFIRLAVNTERTIRNVVPREQQYEYSNTYHVKEIIECYNQYLMVPGFDEEKSRLNRFLDETKSMAN